MSVPEYLQANNANNDFSSQPLDLESMGFPASQPAWATPGINTTYPNQNQAPKISSTSSSDSPGFFGSLWDKIEDTASHVVDDVEAAPGAAWDATKSGAQSAYGGIKSVVGTVGSDIGSGLSSVIGGVESHVFIIFGVAVVGVAIVLWSAGKSGAIHANVNAIV